MATKKTTEPKKTKTFATVINGNLNVRGAESTDADIIRVLENGSKVEILDRGDEWCKIKDGYIMTKFLSF